ncbi:PAS domain-containing sensor histidine kinase [Fibrisoma montanum]|uniref:histidine kinase n=1 Tax=Fibrisoma montanum TaxID=2305895 RepID=A0A418M5N3_9BACT|nr:PAS domain-containing sensor histidine kinase [Fibrisoma montanum]RIV21151.1 PAS domain-containing sensor histidine kinase [Fibrisoma montanum]
MQPQRVASVPHDIVGGGKMGELIRAMDWAKTPVGPMETWPLSLRIIVQFMMDTSFGMYLAWGPELIQIYNDSYRPILGNEKHPNALGSSARDTFPEVWDWLEPIFDGVMQGQAYGAEDLLIPLNRNGYLEDCYFTFSYTPLRDETGQVRGILVPVTETTKVVLARRQQEQQKQQLQTLLMQAPVAIAIFRGPEYRIELANDAHLKIWGRTADEVIGKPLFDALPEAKGQGYEELLANVMTTGEPFYANELYADLIRNGATETVYFNFVYQPLREPDGTISGVIVVANEITEQVEARKKQEENENRLRIALDSAELGTWDYDPQTDVILCDERTVTLFGFQPGDQINLQMALNAIVEPDRQRVTDAILDALSPGSDGYYNLEYSLVNYHDGSLRTIRAMGKAFFDKQGVAYRFTGTALDITESKKAESTLRESETRFRTVADTAPVMIWMSDADNLFNFFNKGWLEFTGRTMEQELGNGWTEGIHPDDFDRCLHTYATSFEARQEFYMEYRLRQHTGQYRWVSNSGSPRFSPDGLFEGFIGASMDIHEQKQALEALAISEARFRQLADSMPQIVWTARPDGYLDYFNQRWYEFTGIDKGYGDAGWTFILHPDDVQPCLNHWHRCLESGAPYRFEFRLRDRHNNGAYRWFLTLATPIRDQTADGQPGDITKWFGTCTDIDDQKRLAELLEERVSERTQELSAANVNLERSNFDLMQFASVASHDLKEPLRKIQAFGNILQTTASPKLSATELNYFDRIIGAANRMQNLVEDVLNLSKLSHQEMEFDCINLSDVISRITDDLEVLIQEKDAQVRIGTLPAMKANLGQMHQLFQNLITNALKFNHSATPVVSIEQIATPANMPLAVHLSSDQYVCVRVADNGIGFDEAYSEKIFGIFQRLHGTKFGGTGIGLAICKKIVENHHGHIWAEGKPNEGASFYVALPVRQVQQV